MNKEPESLNAVSEAALKVFSREELIQMSSPQRRSFLHLVAKRLDEPGSPPTLAELEGIKELVTKHLWHPAFNQLSEQLQDSATTSSKTSA